MFLVKKDKQGSCLKPIPPLISSHCKMKSVNNTVKRYMNKAITGGANDAKITMTITPL